MSKFRWTKKQVFIQQLNCVFGLDGGELESKKWCGRFWYDGAPEYAEQECLETAKKAGFVYPEIRTALEDRLYGADPCPRGWLQLASYRSSGEAQCWCADSDSEGTCKVCEGESTIYIGDGWFEVVYVRKNNNQ